MKAIDHDNWLQADIGRTVRHDEARNWRETILAVSLDPSVPSDVARMFEAARGGLLYGYFFQPLMAMGLEQCYRVLEYGARARCAMADQVVTCADSQGREHPLSFSHNLRSLSRLGLISEEERLRWGQARELRDWVVSPEHHAMLTLEHGSTALARAADLLGRLFNSQSI